MDPGLGQIAIDLRDAEFLPIPYRCPCRKTPRREVGGEGWPQIHQSRLSQDKPAFATKRLWLTLYPLADLHGQGLRNEALLVQAFDRHALPRRRRQAERHFFFQE